MREKAGWNRDLALLVCVLALGFAAPALLAESAMALPGNKGFATVKEILDRSCAACHDWAASYETLVLSPRVVPGKPEASELWQKVASGEMPMGGDPLPTDEQAFLRGWIAAGAPSTELTIAVPADAGATAEAPKPQGFLFFPSKVVFHEVTGFTSTALLYGAGIIGGIHFLDMMRQGHVYRDAIGFTGGSPDATRQPWVIQAWGDDAALRWWHVGLLVAGETLYLVDAITGISMMTPPSPDGKVGKRDIHRVAFFTHAALMLAQVGLGFAETYALSTGQHDLMIGLGAAHTVIGLTIPTVMLAAGLENVLLKE